MSKKRIVPAKYPVFDTMFTPITIDINLEQKEEKTILSISGNLQNSSGQNYETIERCKEMWRMNNGWTEEKLLKLLAIWKRWHLNDMRAGTPRQEEAVRTWLSQGNSYNYKTVCKMLEERNLLVDNNYTYGHSWLYEPLPQDVLDFINEIIKG